MRWENVQIKVDDYHTLASTTFVACTTPPAAPVTPCGVSTYGGADVAGGNRKFEDLLINGGVIVEPWDGIRAYASYAEGYHRPRHRPHHCDRSAATPASISHRISSTSNPLFPNNREIGIELKRGPLDATATYFWSTSSDNGGLLLIAGSRPSISMCSA